MNEFADEAEQLRSAAPEDGATDTLPAPAWEATGHRCVDEVLASLDPLTTMPVSEHVAVFEAAHDRLRSALADAGDDRRD